MESSQTEPIAVHKTTVIKVSLTKILLSTSHAIFKISFHLRVKESPGNLYLQ